MFMVIACVFGGEDFRNLAVCFTNCEHNKCRHFDTLREVQSDFTSSAVQSTLEGGGGDILEIYC